MLLGSHLHTCGENSDGSERCTHSMSMVFASANGKASSLVVWLYVTHAMVAWSGLGGGGGGGVQRAVLPLPPSVTDTGYTYVLSPSFTMLTAQSSHGA